jgi:hypothetical protein
MSLLIFNINYCIMLKVSWNLDKGNGSMAKQLNTPFGKIYPSELLILVAIVLATICMVWFANSVPKYVVAFIAAVTCGYGLYDLCRPVQSGGIASLHGSLGICSLIITLIMIIIYITTLF